MNLVVCDIGRKLLNKGIPSWVNRAAMFGSTILKPSEEEKAKAAERAKIKKPTAKEAKAAKDAYEKPKELNDKQRAMLEKLKKNKK